MNGFDITRPSQIQVLIDGKWQIAPSDVTVAFDGNDLTLTAKTSRVQSVGLRWTTSFAPGARFFGDAWERGYGDLGFSGMTPERVYPWYLLIREGEVSSFLGVKTGCAAFVGFLTDSSGVTLLADTRAGCEGVRLNGRLLRVCTLVSAFDISGDPYDFLCAQARRLCDTPLSPAAPVYGGNNWYYAYGKSSREQILRDTAFIAEMAEGLENRPFMVVDDGWQLHENDGACNGGPWTPNDRFGDMATLASAMKDAGARPGLWYRPLLTEEEVDPAWIRARDASGITLDVSHPEVVEYVRDITRTMSGWGFELLKHDFSTFDIMGDWGFRPHGDRLGKPSPLFDPTRTNAEHILTLYDAILDGAGDALVLGCNTVSHLCAGKAHIMRTGDDTSGKDWERTRRMGVNTLAMRMPQHGAFYASDADCVGSTNEVPWSLNRQWLTLLAKSGTPLFVSADPTKQSAAQRADIREAFVLASQPHPAARPLDWEDTTCPTRWRLFDGEAQFDWHDWYAPDTENIYWR